MSLRVTALTMHCELVRLAYCMPLFALQLSLYWAMGSNEIFPLSTRGCCSSLWRLPWIDGCCHKITQSQNKPACECAEVECLSFVLVTLTNNRPHAALACLPSEGARHLYYFICPYEISFICLRIVLVLLAVVGRPWPTWFDYVIYTT